MDRATIRFRKDLRKRGIVLQPMDERPDWLIAFETWSETNDPRRLATGVGITALLAASLLLGFKCFGAIDKNHKEYEKNAECRLRNWELQNGGR